VRSVGRFIHNRAALSSPLSATLAGAAPGTPGTPAELSAVYSANVGNPPQQFVAALTDFAASREQTAAAAQLAATKAQQAATKAQLAATKARTKAHKVSAEALVQANAQAEGLSTQLAAMSLELAAMSLELTGMTTAHDAAHAEIEKLRREASTAGTKFSTLQSAQVRMQDELTACTAAKASADADCTALGNELLAARAEVKKFEVAGQVLANNNLSNIKAAQAGAEAAKVRLAAAEKDVVSLQQQRNEAGERADVAGKRVQALTDALAAANAELVEKVICTERLRRDMIKAQKNHADLAAQDANIA
jgi:chromosome segregation ATPase